MGVLCGRPLTAGEKSTTQVITYRSVMLIFLWVNGIDCFTFCELVWFGHKEKRYEREKMANGGKSSRRRTRSSRRRRRGGRQEKEEETKQSLSV